MRSMEHWAPIPLYRPRLVWLILMANIVIFLLTWLAARRSEEFSLVLLRYGAQYGPLIAEGEYWRLVTPIFLHGGWMHLLFNSYALYILGPAAEEIFGSLRFGAVYLLSGIAGVVASYGFHPCALSVGASGALFGLMGALGAFYWIGRRLLGDLARLQVRQIVALAAINLIIGFSIPNIDNFAHMGGLGGGVIAGLALAPRYEIVWWFGIPEVRRRDPRTAGWMLIAGIAALLLAVALAFSWLYVTGGLSC